MRFTDFLVKKGTIGSEKLAGLLTKSSEEGISIEKLLEAEGVPEEEILAAKAELSGLPVRRIQKGDVPYEMLRKIPEEAARHYRFVPLGMKDDSLDVGIVDPSDIEAREALQFIISKMDVPLKLFLITEEDFELVVDGYKGLGGEVSKALGDLEMELASAGSSSEDVSKAMMSAESKIVEEAPITKIVAVILRHAIEGNASDIHIEATKDKLKVRFRVDGSLYTSIVLPLSVHEAVVSRIKILCDMKIDEKRKPQDGRFDARIEGREIDFRVSTFPSFFGEKVVIRILDKEKGVKTLKELGFSDPQMKIVKDMIDKPYGLILLTGPTGSGKTTTLYAMLEDLDRETNNVVSLEDPVEYNIESMSQSQVRPEIGYDFASGLRSILRQDPDIIMVGEIRDKETAGLAIHAALTGHLVFSTLHTNSAAGVVPRLIDMGVDPFLIAPTLLMAIGQRLVRSLCSDSRNEVALDRAMKEMINHEIKNMPEEARGKFKLPEKIYEGAISPTCPRGTKGRIGVFEVLYKTPELESIILNNPVEPEIMKEARRQGMLTMKEDGLMKMLNGAISFEEFIKL
ncbi:MAG: GspE/PulE family protein [Candidatus Pacebacteria bacterium]|nr:GspE/PulE family protein [Candidatus Paceibacterota bacterium]NUQ57143.1 type II/IV secretion system protein [Candidatus Paceibacter sp.]